MNKLWGFYNNASAGRIGPRGMHFGYAGWQGFVEGLASDLEAMEIQDFWLSCPFGVTSASANYWLSDLLIARHAGHWGLGSDSDFVSSWRWFREKGFRLVFYVGSPVLDPILAQWGERKGDDDAWTRYALECLQPVLETEAEIGFDTVVSAKVGSRVGKLLVYLRDSVDRKVWLEYSHYSHTQNRTKWHGKGFPYISIYDVWAGHLDVLPDAPEWFLIGPDLKTKEETIPVLKKALPRAHTSVYPWRAKQWGLKASEVYA